MSKREPKLLLKDILDAISKIGIYTDHMAKDEFLKDNKTVDAVIRNLEIIGEAANRLPENVRDSSPEINWHRIRGLRNRLVHDYMGVDNEIVWEIVENELEALGNQISLINNKF